MKLKIALLTCISFPLFSSEYVDPVTTVVMPNTLTIVSILSTNQGLENCFCNDKRNIAIAQTLAGLSMTREELATCLHTMTQDQGPIRPDPACYAKAAVLVVFAESCALKSKV